MPKPKKYSFFNLPKEYGKEDYWESTNTIIKKYSKIKNLLSIYSWGDVSVAGISDIDIVFVFRSDAEPLPFLNRSFNFLDAKTRYLARHPFMFIDEDYFKNIRYVYPDAHFKFLHGKNININNFSVKDKHYSTIALLNDIIIRHYPRDFIGQSVSKSINVRDTLLRLNSLKYTAKFLERLAKEKSAEWNSRLGSIDKLRKKWFEEKDFELLVSLNEDSVDMTMEAIEKFRNFLAKDGFVKVAGDRMQYNGIKNRSIFIKNWKKEKALNDMVNSIKNKKQVYSVLPIELAAQLIEYSKHNGFISRYIRKNLTSNLDYQIKFKNMIKHRIGILNEQARLAFTLKHSDFPAFFDFGYRNRAGINNLILNSLDRLRF